MIQALRRLLQKLLGAPSPRVPRKEGIVEEEEMTIPYLHNKETKLLLQVKADLDRHEGFREYAYPDVLSALYKRFPSEAWGFVPAADILHKIGVSYEEALETGAPWTVGYGFTHGTHPHSRINKQLAERKLEDHILDVHGRLKAVLSWYGATTHITQTVLINMAFNMGLKGLLSFKNTLEHMKNERWAQAAANMRKSLYYRQVRNRAEELARRLETQTIPAEYKAPEKL